MTKPSIAIRRAEFKGVAWKPNMPEPARNEALIARLPSAPCFLCGERGFCRHRREP